MVFIVLSKQSYQNGNKVARSLNLSHTSISQSNKTVKKQTKEKSVTTTQLIKQYCNEYDVNWKIAVAISKCETGHYKSKPCIKLHNYGGMMRNGELISYSTKEEGIIAFVICLKELYFDIGLNTIRLIQPKYCPNNDNDWVEVVTDIYYTL